MSTLLSLKAGSLTLWLLVGSHSWEISGRTVREVRAPTALASSARLQVGAVLHLQPQFLPGGLPSLGFSLTTLWRCRLFSSGALIHIGSQSDLFMYTWPLAEYLTCGSWMDTYLLGENEYKTIEMTIKKPIKIFKMSFSTLFFLFPKNVVSNSGTENRKTELLGSWVGGRDTPAELPFKWQF